VPRRSATIQGKDAGVFVAGVRAIETELNLPGEFPAHVLAAAAEAAAHPRLPGLDRTDLPLVTIDPPASKDLDQALHLERRRNGYRVFYAIADVAAFVEPDGPVDVEAHVRGETLYGPDHRIPLHPPVLGEGAASLLPGQLRPAVLWTIDLDSAGEGTMIDVSRALVRSHARLDYETVQRRLTDGTADQVFTLLKEVGELRMHREAERGGVSLPLPEQEIVVADGGWSLDYRRLLPVEEWNAQVSLLTGMACAQIMLYGEVGIVRTLPPPPHSAVARLRRTAAALKLDWRAEVTYPDFARSIDPNTPTGAAMLNACLTLLRGAGYVAFEGGVPDHIEHAALASEYAHVTAPLRRLVDRYAGEIAVALCADNPIPEWVGARLRDLPKEMNEAEQRSHQFERAVLSLVEAGTLADRVGEAFTGVITDTEARRPAEGLVMLHDPAVEARVDAPAGRVLPLGREVLVRLVEADPARRVVRFELVT
jgi:exoribonuclease R